jgi:hypothetical protein
MKEYYDFSKGRKNSHAEKILKEGYSVTIHYSPEDITEGYFDDTKDIIQALVELISDDDAKHLLAHIKDNYEFPSSDDLWVSANRS